MSSSELVERRRRNVRLALIHVVLALGFLVAFVWHTAHQG